MSLHLLVMSEAVVRFFFVADPETGIASAQKMVHFRFRWPSLVAADH